MEKAKRKRCPDYSELEVLTLLEFVSSHKATLFGTGGKGSSKEEKVKERYWKKAALMLHAAGGPVREWTQCRKKWRDLTSKAKAYKAPKTGGGPPLHEDPLYERILGILAKEVVVGIIQEDDVASSQETVFTEPEEDCGVPSPPEVPVIGDVPQAASCSSSVLRPAAVRQCQVQEELLLIQRQMLNIQKEQLVALQSIAEAIDNASKKIIV